MGITSDKPKSTISSLLKWGAICLFFSTIAFGVSYAASQTGTENSSGMQEEVVMALHSVSSAGIGQDSGGDVTLSVEKAPMMVTLVVQILLMLGVLLALLFVSVNLSNVIRIREGREPYTLMGTMAHMKDLALNPYIASIGTFVVLIVALFFVVPQARSVGLQPGYAPEQPVKFSHKLHAGKNQIDCKYCHTGVTKGKNAWIPSVNVCMNCHKAIEEGPVYGKTEIAKVRRAYENNQPIQWVRVHNLPDLAYFNHKQHVVVGGLDCVECHGDVASMEKVEQVSELSMGWCVNCHRTTEVNKELYHNLGRDDVNTVEDIGGLSCARCHY